MKKYETIKAVLEAVQAGELDETQMAVVMDNDCSSIHYGRYSEDIDNCIFRGRGYWDVEALWPLVFPKAAVEWC